MNEETVVKRELLKEYFASRGGDGPWIYRFRKALEKVGMKDLEAYSGGLTFSEAVEVLYGKLERGEII